MHNLGYCIFWMRLFFFIFLERTLWLSWIKSHFSLQKLSSLFFELPCSFRFHSLCKRLIQEPTWKILWSQRVDSLLSDSISLLTDCTSPQLKSAKRNWNNSLDYNDKMILHIIITREEEKSLQSVLDLSD